MADSTVRDEWGHDEEDSDLCRVCRSEAEEGRPLIYPCKCSGSVRFVHADCLQEWLSHSRKRHCEICGHTYMFTKVYPTSLPSTIPTVVYVRQSLMVASRLAWQMARIIIVIISWLVVLPVVTMSSLRIMLSTVDTMSYGSILYGFRAVVTDSHAHLNRTLALPNATLDGVMSNTTMTGRQKVVAAVARNGTLDFRPSFFDRMTADRQNFMAFVFRGQLVAVFVAVGIIGLILLREWMGQIEWQARPVVDEQGELRPNEWVFRNGQALRVVDLEATRDGGSDKATDGNGAAEAGDINVLPVYPTGPVNVQPHPGFAEHDPPAFGEHDSFATQIARALNPDIDDDPQQNDADGNNRYVRPAASHVAFVAPELLDNKVAQRPPFWDQPEAGPSSRPAADVPEDAVSQASSPARRDSWLHVPQGGLEVGAPSSSRGSSPRPRGDESPRGHWYDTDAGELERVETTTNSTATLDSSPGFRRASDPGPDLTTPVVERPERPYGSQGFPERMPMIAESAPHSPHGGYVQPDQPHIGVLLDALNDRPAATTEAPANGAAAPAVALNHQHEADPDEAWEFEDDDEGVAGDVEFVERVMARNEHEAVGMDVIPPEEDDRPLDADDWDGIFEVVGFIGPLTGLLQNHIFVSCAMAVVLMIVIGVPVFIGKFMLATDFVRINGDLFTMLFRSTSYVSNIVIDSCVWILREIFLFPRMVTRPLYRFLFKILGLNAIRSGVGSAASKLGSLGSSLVMKTSSSEVATNATAVAIPLVTPAVDRVLDGFELLGESAHELYKAVRIACISIAASPDASDLVICFFVGYMSLACGLILMFLADAANFFNLSPAFMDRTRSLQVFMKVAFFIVIEMLCFPIFVGFTIGWTSLSMFGTTISAVLGYIAVRPFSGFFIAWCCGTIFMVSFSTFLSEMRKICRPGALYFIRNPSDPTHSPVKEIMDRPALAQIPRLAYSAIMYFVVVTTILGLIPFTLKTLGKVVNPLANFFPLRLEERPVSSVPFDLLLLHLMLPPSWEGLFIERRMKRAFLFWWAWSVRQVDLMSLVFGIQGRMRAQSKLTHRAWLVADAMCQFVFGTYDNRSTAARVPRSDRVELAPLAERRREGVFIPLDHRGVPKTEADKLRLLKQDRAARRVGRNPRTDYEVVTLPEYWRTRVYVLICLILLSAGTAIASVLLIPLAVGRQTAALFLDAPIYDGYSWMIGVYVCLSSFSMGRQLRNFLVAAGRAGQLRQSGRTTRVKRSIFAFFRGVYAVGILYFVLPLLFGINFELCVSIPARYGFSSDVTPVLHIWDAWATGTTLISIYVAALGAPEPARRMTRGARFRTAFKRPFRQSYRRLNRWCLSLMLYLIAPIVLPWVVFVGLRSGLVLAGVPLPAVDNSWVFRLTYPMTTTAFYIASHWSMFSKLAQLVRQWLIDAEYVLEERVENYEPNAPAAGAQVDEEPATVEVMEGDQWVLQEGSDGEWEDEGEAEARAPAEVVL